MKNKKQFLYAPELVQSWKTLNIDHFGVKVPINTEPAMGQYWMPIFESEEDCRREYPDYNCMRFKA